MSDTASQGASAILKETGSDMGPQQAPSEAISTATSSAFSPAQAAEIAQDLINRGVSPERVAEAMRADGFDMQAKTVDQRNDKQREVDSAFGGARPEEYDLPPMQKSTDRLDMDIHNGQLAMRNWLSEMKLPKGIGSFVATEVIKIGDHYRSMNSADREIYSRNERVRVEKIFGKETEHNIELARQLVDEVETKRPGFRRFLEDTGAGDSAAVIVQLAEHAKRLKFRNE